MMIRIGFFLAPLALALFCLCACGDSGSSTDEDPIGTEVGADTADEADGNAMGGDGNGTPDPRDDDTTGPEDPKDPCDPSPCLNPPPASCDGDSVVTHEPEGSCTVDVATNTAKCAYTQLDPSPCAAAEICTVGQCAQPGDPTTYEFTDDVTYLSSIQVPMDAADGECCFDYNDDGEIDNKLGKVLKALKSIFDANASLKDAVEGGSVVVLLEYLGLDNHGDDDDVSISGFFADTTAAYADNISGNADFEAGLDSFLPGTSTPIIHFATGSITGGLLEAGPALFILSLPLLDGVDLVLNVHQTRIEAEVATGTAGENGDRGLNFTGGRLGGVIPMEELYGALNGFISASCDCLGLAEGEPWLDWPGEGFDATCSPTAKANKDDCDAPDEDVCNQLAGFCTIIVGVLSPDIDIDNNGLEESLSLGLFIDGVSANITGVAAEEEVSAE